MNDAELHRQEFLLERVGMLMDDNPRMDEDEAMFRAVCIWNAMQALAMDSQEPAK